MELAKKVKLLNRQNDRSHEVKPEFKGFKSENKIELNSAKEASEILRGFKSAIEAIDDEHLSQEEVEQRIDENAANRWMTKHREQKWLNQKKLIL